MRRLVAALLLLVVLAAGFVAMHLSPPASPVLATITTSNAPNPAAMDFAAGRVVVGDGDSRRVQVVDTRAARVVATVSLGEPVSPFPFGGQYASGTTVLSHRAIVVTALQNGPASMHLDLLDVAAGRLLRAIPLSTAAEATALAIDPQTRRLFLEQAHFPSISIAMYGATKLRYLRTIQVSASSLAANTGWGWSSSIIAVDTRTAHVFVAHADSNTVSVLDAHDGHTVQTIVLHPFDNLQNGSRQLLGLAVNEALHRLYIIDGVHNTSTSWIRLPAGCWRACPACSSMAT